MADSFAVSTTSLPVPPDTAPLPMLIDTSPFPTSTVVSPAASVPDAESAPVRARRAAGIAANEKSPFTSSYVNFSSMLNGVRMKPSCIEAVALLARGSQNLP